MTRSLSWDNYRYVLAIHRCESISSAARSLGVNETTVSRRLAQTEQYLQVKLFTRRSTGLIATDAGVRVVERVNRAKAELDHAFTDARENKSSVSGLVRLACDDLLLNHMLLPRLDGLMQAHPDMTCHLATRSPGDSLGDADIAVVPGPQRPVTGSGTAQSMWSLGTLQLGVLVEKNQLTRLPSSDIPWVMLSSAASSRLHATDPPIENTQAYATRITVESNEALLSCVTAGLGKACLPVGIARRDQRLVCMEQENLQESVELFCQCQPDLIDTPRLEICVQWLEKCIALFDAD